MIHISHYEQIMDVDQEIERLVWQYYDQIFHLALSILDEPDAAADAAQDTFVSASQKLTSFRGEASVKTWLYAIAINTCRGYLRRQKARARMQRSWPVVQALFQRPLPVETELTQADENKALWGAVDGLAERHRMPVILHYLHGFTAAEIATMLDIAEGTVHSRLFYARKLLKSVLQEERHHVD